LTFAERVNNINIDVFHRVRDAELRTNQSTFFLQTLRSWQDVNLTSQFTRLCSELSPYIDSLMLLLHHKQQVLDILLKYIDMHVMGYELIDDDAPDRADEPIGDDEQGSNLLTIDTADKKKSGKRKQRGGKNNNDDDDDNDNNNNKGYREETSLLSNTKRKTRKAQQITIDTGDVDQVTAIASEPLQPTTRMRKIHSTGTAIKPILELVAAFARDLQSEFYDFFPRVLHALMQLVDPQDPNLLECVFSCLGLLFKCLHRLMLEDLPNVFAHYRSLLFTEHIKGTRKSFIRAFAAETFSFLLRKIKSRQRLSMMLDIMLQSVHDDSIEVDKEIVIDGLCRLLFQTIKVPPHTNAQMH
jgi:hypothetical protein